MHLSEAQVILDIRRLCKPRISLWLGNTLYGNHLVSTICNPHAPIHRLIIIKQRQALHRLIISKRVPLQQLKSMSKRRMKSRKGSGIEFDPYKLKQEHWGQSIFRFATERGNDKEAFVHLCHFTGLCVDGIPGKAWRRTREEVGGLKEWQGQARGRGAAGCGGLRCRTFWHALTRFVISKCEIPKRVNAKQNERQTEAETPTPLKQNPGF